MTKYFCDKCEKEITDENECVGGNISSGRVGTEIEYRTKGQSPMEKSHKLKVEIIHSHNGTANAGLFCKYCILDAFARLDDRPRQA